MALAGSRRSDDNGAAGERSRPAGIPISRSLLIRPGIANDDLREAVAAINRVHGDGVLPSIPMSLRESLINEEGRPVDGLLRFEQIPDGRIVARSIQIRDAAPHRLYVAIHEVGHFLDLHGLPGPAFASADERVTLLVEWRRAIGRSKAVQTLRDLVAGDDTALRDQATRLLEAEELWARSYAQFVAIRGRLRVLRSSLDVLRYREPHTLYCPRQWDDDDFAVIDAAIEQMFRRLEWIA